MSTIDANRVILTGENSVIRLSPIDSDSFTTNATFWRILSSPGGPGHVLYLKSELTEARWRIYSDNIAMARWLQSTLLGAINAELLDMTIAVTDALFSKSGDARDFWTERLEARGEQIVLTWYQMGEPRAERRDNHRAHPIGTAGNCIGLGVDQERFAHLIPSEHDLFAAGLQTFCPEVARIT